MSLSRRTGLALAWRVLLAAAVGLTAQLVLADAGMAAPTGEPDFVKYYTVAESYQGKPENLSEIAQRFLGASGRATEIFNLNSGRRQPDGGVLADPDRLRPGWFLVLPWDSFGAGVQYGLLPTASPVPNGSPSASPTAARPSTRPGDSGACAVIGAASSNQSDWATLRLRTDQTWSRSKGDGEMVAVIDSGVDASLPQLAGHVAQGADTVTGRGKGDTDCLGSGTGMAGIIAAQPVTGSALVGLAPGATVLPVRVIADDPVPKPADVVAAIQAAVSAGSKVLALGTYVDLNDVAVAQAISASVQHDVVVVMPAPTVGVPIPASGNRTPAGLLRVGGVGVDSQTAAQYLAGSVDVVAPGLNVTTLNASGTGALAASGTQYAVAFAAGEAALVRASFPDLSAAEVVNRIQATADQIGDGHPDSRYGWGMINPGAAVTQDLGAVGRTKTPPRSGPDRPGGPPDTRLIALLGSLAGMIAAILIILRILRLVRVHDPAKHPDAASAAAVARNATAPQQAAESVATRHPDPG